MAEMGHEDQFRPRRVSDRCGFGERTFPETRGNDEVAPKDPMGVWLATGAL
jgi:hypothetical protein